MYETTIREIIKKDKVCSKLFLDVFARDEIPKSITSTPACFILNTHVRTKPGEHWLAVYIDEENKLEFFDSYGRAPDLYKLTNYLNNLSKDVSYNRQRIQGNSQFCGLYCLLFLLFRARNKEKKFFSSFTNNYKKNDKFIIDQIKNYVRTNK